MTPRHCSRLRRLQQPRRYGLVKEHLSQTLRSLLCEPAVAGEAISSGQCMSEIASVVHSVLFLAMTGLRSAKRQARTGIVS